MPLHFAFGIDLLLTVRLCQSNEGCGKNRSTVAGIVDASDINVAQKSPENIFVEHVSLHFTAFGLVAAKLNNKLVIAHLTKAEMEYLDWSLLGPGLSPRNMITLVHRHLGYSGLNAKLCTGHLQIKLFTIAYPLRTTANQGNGMNTNNAYISSSSDKNCLTHRRKASTNYATLDSNNYGPTYFKENCDLIQPYSLNICNYFPETSECVHINLYSLHFIKKKFREKKIYFSYK
uniref:Uncharacterized protein n=1 Tax=Glossina pallidipes TaxID=7398 RepID=A0A1A9ZS95_GLOPL